MLRKINMLEVDITASSITEILEYIITRLKNGGKKWYIVTPNPEMVVYANKDFRFKKILNEAEIALPDGVGIVWGAKLMDKGLKRRITGVEMVEEICEKASKEGLALGFLGGRNGVAESAIDCLRKNYPGLKAGFVGEGWDEQMVKKLMMHYDIDKIDLLFVAYGHPKQEKWIYENLHRLPVQSAMGVGGAYDFISGQIPRAPGFVRKMGFEWLFRLIIQPWRWRRQLSLLEFIFLVLKETAFIRLGLLSQFKK